MTCKGVSRSLCGVAYTNETFSEYMYLVNVRFKNINNQYDNNAGINLGQYILQETSYINFIDQEAYGLINDFDSIQFSLRINSEKEFIIPFQIDSFYIDKNQLKKGNPQLVISLYPHKKVVELKKILLMKHILDGDIRIGF